jgi:cytochrome c-type biogenesis protein CcmF
MWQAYADVERVEHWALSAVGNGSLPIWILMTAFLHFTMPREQGRYRLLVVPLFLAAMLVVLVAGESLAVRSGISLMSGEAATLKDPFGKSWTFTSLGLSRYSVLNREVTAVALDVTVDGKASVLIASERRQYFDSRGAPTFEPSSEAGISRLWLQDVYVVLDGLRQDGSASIRVGFNPLMRWFWTAGVLLLLGGLMVMTTRAPIEARGDS